MLNAIKYYDLHIYVSMSDCHIPFKKTGIFNGIASLVSGIPGRYMAVNG
ncbi:MAG: hypothetical protein ACTSXM_14040 [Promethearchaeota archaeon]